MELEALVESLESLDSRRGSKLLRTAKGREGLSRAYLERLLQHFGTDHSAAARLGAHSKSLLRNADRKDLACRAVAISDLVNGRWRSSARFFQLAGELAEDPVDRLSFKVGALHALGKAGKIDDAVSVGREIMEGLTALGQSSLAARAALNVGNVLLEVDRYAEAIDFLNQAIPVLDSGNHATESVSAHLALSTANLYGGSLSIAKSESEQVIKKARKLKSPHLERLASINLAHIALLRGKADEALDAFIRIQDELADVPAEQARCQEYLGDAYLRLNLWDEAIDAYRLALVNPAIGGRAKANVELGIGQAYAGAGLEGPALEAFRRAYRIYRRIGNEAWASAALSSEAALTDSKSISRRAIRVARESGSPYHLAVALLISGDSGERQEAREIIRRYGFGSLEWRAYYLEARSSTGIERLRAYRRMFQAIESGRAAVRSTTSRTNYLRDKTEALREYLGELLQKPTRARIDEAVRVVVQSRSVALLDEVLGSSSLQVREQDQERLRALRDELRTLTDTEPVAGTQRRLVGKVEDLASIQRRWHEASRVLFEERIPQAASARPDTAVFIQANERTYAVIGSHSIPIDVSPSGVEEAIKWLYFDLSEPLVDQAATPDRAVKALRQIGEQILGPLLPYLSEVEGLSADGCLWQVPWDACLMAMDIDKDLEVRLHPGFRGEEPRRRDDSARVALWVSTPPDLPYADSEARAFLALYPQAQRFDTAESVRRECRGGYDLIHVIGHARQRNANPMFSYFAFPDEPLYATEVARLPLTTDLAVLSACETGALSLSTRDEPDGLARAFLARGAGSVVASAWPFDDEAANRFSCDIYRHIRNGYSVRCAVKRGRMNLRSWNAHPYFWGCPVVYGGYRS